MITLCRNGIGISWGYDIPLDMNNYTEEEHKMIEEGYSNYAIYQMEKISQDDDLSRDHRTPLKVLCETKIVGFTFDEIISVLNQTDKSISDIFRTLFYYAIEKHNREVSYGKWNRVIIFR